MIKVSKKKIENLLIFNTKTYRDKRGYFREIFKEKLIKKRFPFQVMSFSKKNVIRGLHYQTKNLQGHFIHIINGKILDVGIDLRLRSKTFKKITCNIVAPGHIETERPISAGARPPLSVKPPVNRFGQVEEIASIVHFLCLPDAGYITGQTMHVNGDLHYGT